MPSYCSICGKPIPAGERLCESCMAGAAVSSPSAATGINWRAVLGVLVFAVLAALGMSVQKGSPRSLAFMPPPTPTRTPRPLPTRTPTPLPTETPLFTGPYAEGMQPLIPDLVVGASENLLNPRGVAEAPDGSIYITDTGTNRVLHFTSGGDLIGDWGGLGDSPGAFNGPWGVAVGPDGAVYVADTWNHRIQKFGAQGEFITAWGAFGNDGAPTSLWGPRDIVFDANGRMFVTDTGNKRVLVFTLEGEAITQFGSEGSEFSQFDEPVGLALGDHDILYVADTWNLRVQSFIAASDQRTFTPVFAWDISGWEGGESTENKPYIAASPEGTLLVTDPYNGLVLEFSPVGEYLRGWSFGGGALFNGIAVDPDGNVWVADATAGRVLRFRR